MNNNYNSIAPVYDRLARLVFGKSQLAAQRYLLHFIKPNDRILIVGGGTGLILEDIAKLHTAGLEIVYVEKAAAMLDRAKRRNCGGNKIDFVNADIVDQSFQSDFHIVITAFLFDNFTEAFSEFVFNKLHAYLREDGIWLYTDFEINDKSKIYHKVLLKLMYWFFSLSAEVRVSKLPDMKKHFAGSGYKLMLEKTFCDGFISSCAYAKTSQRRP